MNYEINLHQKFIICTLFIMLYYISIFNPQEFHTVYPQTHIFYLLHAD
jgi:hypothetical protein